MSVLVHVEHGKIPPVIDEHSAVLILGTMPSPKSREAGFYYAHPQNRFWPVLAKVFHEAVPQGTDERRAFALRHGIALLLKNSNIRAVFAAGKTAARLYRRFCEPCGCMPCIELPSTSPANARMRLPELAEKYGAIAEYTKQK